MLEPTSNIYSLFISLWIYLERKLECLHCTLKGITFLQCLFVAACNQTAFCWLCNHLPLQKWILLFFNDIQTLVSSLYCIRYQVVFTFFSIHLVLSNQCINYIYTVRLRRYLRSCKLVLILLKW